MFCNQCGKPLPDNSTSCQYCGAVFRKNNGQQGGYQMPPMGGMPNVRKRAGIDNIFSALLYEKTTGTIMEFSLWCAVCVFVILAFIATVTVGNRFSYLGSLGGGFRALWIFIMIFGIGLAVLMAFRKKAISLLYSSLVFSFIMLISYYVTVSGMIDRKLGSVSGIVIAVFILNLLVGIALVTCSSIHFFSKINLGFVTAILSIISAAFNIIMMLCMYFSSGGSSSSNRVSLGYLEDLYESLQESSEELLNIKAVVFSESSFWLGSIAFIGICIVVAIFYFGFFKGSIDNTKDKIYVFSQEGKVPKNNPVFYPGIQCIQGQYAGQTMYIQGSGLIIGSGQGVNLLFQDPCVSHQHCTIRFNPTTGFYEVLDSSTNGTYMSNGQRLQRGVFTSCQRGSVLCIGSVGQQIRLL